MSESLVVFILKEFPLKGPDPLNEYSIGGLFIGDVSGKKLPSDPVASINETRKGQELSSMSIEKSELVML